MGALACSASCRQLSSSTPPGGKNRHNPEPQHGAAETVSCLKTATSHSPSLVIPEDSKWRSIQHYRAASHYCTTAFSLARGLNTWPISAGSIVGQIMRAGQSSLKQTQNAKERKNKMTKKKWWKWQDGGDNQNNCRCRKLSLSGKHWKERKYREWAWWLSLENCLRRKASTKRDMQHLFAIGGTPQKIL